jgi:hypothetical protein
MRVYKVKNAILIKYKYRKPSFSVPWGTDYLTHDQDCYIFENRFLTFFERIYNLYEELF